MVFAYSLTREIEERKPGKESLRARPAAPVVARSRTHTLWVKLSKSPHGWLPAKARGWPDNYRVPAPAEVRNAPTRRLSQFQPFEARARI